MKWCDTNEPNDERTWLAVGFIQMKVMSDDLSKTNCNRCGQSDRSSKNEKYE